MTLDDLFNRASPEPTSGCWLWEGGSKGSNGYGGVWYEGRNHYAHRIAVLLSGRQIPPGIQVDHLCRVRCCINPAHLDLVTNQENARRGETGVRSAALRRAVPHCTHGHPYDEANTAYTKAGYRKCRACDRLQAKARYHSSKRKHHDIRQEDRHRGD